MRLMTREGAQALKTSVTVLKSLSWEISVKRGLVGL